MDAQKKTVVVAEDEPLILMLAVDLLTEAGFDVIATTQADEALATLNARAAGVDVLFTDIHMPGPMNGLDLAHHVRTHWPWVQMLVVSGKAAPAASEMPEGTLFMRKPYDPARIVAHVRALAAA